VGFLYPLFLIAGLSLAVPLLIHLFNLRRYKTVFFPHTRFLKTIQLRSRRSSEVRYKWLLALRMLILALLVLAFAQPLLNRQQSAVKSNALQVIYIDNNPAMNLKSGARSGLEAAIGAARQQLAAAGSDDRFILITNDRIHSYEPQPATRIQSALDGIGTSASGKDAAQVFASVQSLLQSHPGYNADLYYYSNFPQAQFAAKPEAAAIRNISLHAVAVQPSQRTNLFIDTAALNAPVLQAGQSNALIVRSRQVPAGATSDQQPVIQLSINGQVKSAASPVFNASGESIDTLAFSVDAAGWQELSLNISDAALRTDDTFRIAARSAPGLSVLVLNENAQSPYILAAFRSYSGFNVRTESVTSAPSDWSPYNLIILNGITRLPDAVGAQLRTALQSGRSVCLFPARSRDLSALNTSLAYAGDIRAVGLDTTTQTATTLQSGAEIVRDLFEAIPSNVQLPVANWHYSYSAGLAANAQTVIGFRNGDPLLARYSAGRGNFYLAAHSADIEAGNFAASYFFVPFLYQMAAHSRGGDVYALSAGAGQSAFLPTTNSNERNMIHLIGPGLDAIPPQRSAGGGSEVFVDAVVRTPGFYRLQAPSGDSAIVALNGTRAYSQLQFWDIDKLRAAWPDPKASWQLPGAAAPTSRANGGWALPLWKVCAILALILLAAESFVLMRRRAVPSTTTS
jgi:hypothetical protein